MRAFGSWMIVGIITLVLMEVSLRLGFQARLGDLRPNVLRGETFFFQRDAVTGWAHKPGISGSFTNGVYRGSVHIDERGIRQNAATSTVESGAGTVFLIGDSTAANFEVNDDQTIAALVEGTLRDRGTRVNVRNLGVRGYGTDQAVLRAQALADLQPRTVLYLFTNNDPFDTNAYHLPGRLLGKGTFVRRAGAAAFSPYNYPVPVYDSQEAGVVLLDHHCEPVLHKRTLPVSVSRPSLVVWLKQYLWTLRALSYVRHGPPQPPLLLVDPIDYLTEGRDWDPDLYTSYHEQGPVRLRCPEYFEAQIADLLTRLRQIPSVERVLVAHYPDNEIFADLANGRPVPSVTMFHRLLASGVIDGYLNLAQLFVDQGLDYGALACPGDGHLCEHGIRWEADEIVKAFGPLF